MARISTGCSDSHLRPRENASASRPRPSCNSSGPTLRPIGFPRPSGLGGCHSRSYDYLRGLGAWTGIFGSTGGWNRQRPAARNAASRGPTSGPRRRRSWKWAAGSFPAGSASTGEFCRPNAAARCSIATSRCRAAAPAMVRRTRRWWSICPAAASSLAATSFPTAARTPTERRNTKPVLPGTPRPCTCSRSGPGRSESGDALGLVIYRGRDLAAAEVFACPKPFRAPPQPDIWLGGKRLTMPAGTAEKPAEVPIPRAQPRAALWQCRGWRPRAVELHDQ